MRLHLDRSAAGRQRATLLIAGAISFLVTSPALSEWPQWGGTGADFTVAGSKLADTWPEEGPPVFWQRPLGDGYSAIVTDGKRLFTMYRQTVESGKGTEVIVGLDPESGETLWEHTYDAHVDPTDQSHDLKYGKGPNSTPLVADGRVYALGFTGMLHCLDAASGKVVWFHDLWKGFKVEMPYFGHSSSPIRHGDALIVLAGGVMAFDLESGKLLWDNWDVKSSYASPRVIRVGGKEQILAPLAGEIAGLDPRTGKALWHVEHANQYKTILNSPVVMDDDLVFVSAAWVGSRVLRVGGPGAETPVEEIWHNKKMQIAHSNSVRVGDWLYATSGVEVDFLSAINLKTGEIAWKERGFAMANLLYAGGRFILLDEDGVLALADLSPDGLTVQHKVQLFDSRSWTAPTLVGTRLYVRNTEKILAVDLGAPASPRATADARRPANTGVTASGR